MRKLFGAVAVAAMAFAGQANAAQVGFNATVTVVISSLPGIAVAVSSPDGLTLNGSGGLGALTSVAFGSGIFNTVSSLPVTDPAAFPIGGVKATVLNGVANFALGGEMPVIGTANVCLFLACNSGPPANVDVPFTQMGTRGVGIGGGPIVVAGLVNVTVQGAPWSTGMVEVATAMGSVSQTGFVHGPASGGAATAAADGGVIRLVTPIVINTNIGASATLPAFGVLEITFAAIPEPGTLLLLASGAVGLGILGRKRMSK